jgi:stage II sporulation protein D
MLSTATNAAAGNKKNAKKKSAVAASAKVKRNKKRNTGKPTGKPAKPELKQTKDQLIADEPTHGLEQLTTHMANAHIKKLDLNHDLAKIRVLLQEHPLSEENKFIIKSKHGFVLESPVDSNITAVYQAHELHLLCKNNKLYLQCKDGKYRGIKHGSIEICDPHRRLTLGAITYAGSIIMQVDADRQKILVINKLPLEEYVYSVVRNECIPTWPHEMQKIQAIISRSYALYVMRRVKKKNTPYHYFDIKNTNQHQIYNGTHGLSHLRQAIDETENLVLCYKDEPALTMFDICCGGVTPGNIRNRDSDKPYLGRKKPCLYCTESSSYQWKFKKDFKKFIAELKASNHCGSKLTGFGDTIKDIKIIDADRAGVVHKIKITDEKNRTVIVLGEDIRRTWIHGVKSLWFSLETNQHTITIAGRGYGHLRGVCQFGCKELLKQGWSIKSILEFYYPGTELRRV